MLPFRQSGHPAGDERARRDAGTKNRPVSCIAKADRSHFLPPLASTRRLDMVQDAIRAQHQRLRSPHADLTAARIAFHNRFHGQSPVPLGVNAFISAPSGRRNGCLIPCAAAAASPYHAEL